jgi:hypothetical protein
MHKPVPFDDIYQPASLVMKGVPQKKTRDLRLRNQRIWIHYCESCFKLPRGERGDLRWATLGQIDVSPLHLSPISRLLQHIPHADYVAASDSGR